MWKVFTGNITAYTQSSVHTCTANLACLDINQTSSMWEADSFLCKRANRCSEVMGRLHIFVYSLYCIWKQTLLDIHSYSQGGVGCTPDSNLEQLSLPPIMSVWSNFIAKPSEHGLSRLSIKPAILVRRCEPCETFWDMFVSKEHRRWCSGIQK